MEKVLRGSVQPLIGSIPYTDKFRPWDLTYDPENDCFICPRSQELRHTTTSKNGKRTYRSTPKICQSCPCLQVCSANEKGERLLSTHIWQEYLDLAEQLRKIQRGKEIYSLRKKTIERVFSDAKEKHGMRYTHLRGLARVSAWVRLKFVAMSLKNWLSGVPHPPLFPRFFHPFPFLSSLYPLLPSLCRLNFSFV